MTVKSIHVKNAKNEAKSASFRVVKIQFLAQRTSRVGPNCDVARRTQKRLNSSRQHIPDLAIYFLNGWAYDKNPTVNLIELGKTHLLVLDTLS
jgi:hypothetical protein